MQFVCHGDKCPLFIDTGLKKLHKIPDQSAQFLLPFYQGSVFDRIQCIVHKMGRDLILQGFQLRILFQPFLLDHSGDQIFQIIQHVIKFPAQGSNLILCGHIHPKAQITFADFFHRICHIFYRFIHGSRDGCGKDPTDHEKKEENCHEKDLHLL